LGGIQDILFIFISWIIKALPLGIFGFVSVCVADYRASGSGLGSLFTYFSAVVGANLIQGLLVLPLFLLVKRLNPFRIMKGMSKALLVAFFSKSSAGTLPVTMECAEKENGIHPRVSRFVLPVCTTINMNGCAAFILITVVYLMQNNGTPVTPLPLLSWIFIATVAAVGNAGVPMGCFFLSASLLASMGVPLELLGGILPVYAVIDMVETALNVWSDSCVAAAVNKDLGARLEDLPEAGSPGERTGEQAG
jgi:Na+/H+-dicarboxylate symporter